MHIIERLRKVEASKCILFLGAHFSKGAISNSKNYQEIPDVSQLKENLSKIAKLEGDYTLDEIADEAIREDSTLVEKRLKEWYRCSKPTQSQIDILSLDWKRVYTTNYDDVIEHCFQKNSKDFRTFSISDPLPSKLKLRSVIHLHGYIRALSTGDFDEALILSEKAYSRRIFEQSTWKDQFKIDLELASEVIFAGYSVKDYQIQHLLLAEPRLKQKTFFIAGNNLDKLSKNRFSDYGINTGLGVEDLAKICLENAPEINTSNDLNVLRNFTKISFLKDKKSVRRPTATDVWELIVKGNNDTNLIHSDIEGNNYFVSRTRSIEKVVKSFDEKNTKTIIIHSGLGNGKSIFLSAVVGQLNLHGFNCFKLGVTDFIGEDEIDALKSVEKLCIFTENLFEDRKILSKLKYELPNAIFIGTIRTSDLIIKFSEITFDIASPYETLDINILSPKERKKFQELLRASGLKEYSIIQTENQHQIREIVTKLYEDGELAKRIEKYVIAELNNHLLKSTFVYLICFGIFDININASTFKGLTDIDIYIVKANHNKFLSEFISADVGSLKFRSPILASHLVRNVVEFDEITNLLRKMIRKLSDMDDIRYSRRIFAQLVKYSNLKSLSDQNVSNKIRDYYEDIRYLPQVNNEPLFWLQYAISWVDARNYKKASMYIDTAYRRAEEIDGFNTYQIDTQALRVAMGKTIHDDDYDIQYVFERLEKVYDRLNLANNRSFHAIIVFQNLKTYIKKVKSRMTINQKNMHIILFDKIETVFNDLPTNVKVETGSEKVKDIITQASFILTMPD